MTTETLEARITRLEQQMNRLLGDSAPAGEPAPDAWEQTVGMFRGDPVFKEMLDEAQRMREESRRLARQADESER